MSWTQRTIALAIAPVAFLGPQAVHSLDAGISPTSAHANWRDQYLSNHKYLGVFYNHEKSAKSSASTMKDTYYGDQIRVRDYISDVNKTDDRGAQGHINFYAHKNHCYVGGESISCGTGWWKHDDWSSPVFKGYGTEMWPTSDVASNGNSMRAAVKICRDRPWYHGGDVCSAPRHGGFNY